MGIQRSNRNTATFHLLHDLGKVIRLCVAAGKKRGFALVEFGIGKGDVVAHDANKHIASAVGDEAETALHGASIAGRVDHHIEKVAVSQSFCMGFGVVIGDQRPVGTERGDREIEAVLARVHDGHVGAARLGEDDGGHADRAGTDDEDTVGGGNAAAFDAMGADRQEFDHRGFVQRRLAGRDDIRLRHAEEFRHAAVAMHAEDGKALTGIGYAAATGDAFAASKVGNDVDILSISQAVRTVCVLDGAGEFVAHHAWILEEGVFALINMKIRAANADTPDAYQHLAFRRGGDIALDQR